jgi:predicted nucleic acid-binding protein
MVFLHQAIVERDGKIIFNLNGESDVKELRVTASTDILDSNIKETQSALDRKSRSLEILKQRNIPFITRLPVIVSDEDVQIRPKEEVAKRAIALAIISTYAADLANKTPETNVKSFLTL